MWFIVSLFAFTFKENGFLNKSEKDGELIDK